MIGVPFDGGVTNRPGARHGPRAVRVASTLMRGINHHTRVAPFDVCDVVDAGDVPIHHVYDVGKAHKEIQGFASGLVGSSSSPASRLLSVGGDHSVTLPLLKAVSAQAGQPLSLVHIDAHTDTWDELWGERDHHGAPIRRAVEAGVIDPRRTIQIGIRGTQNFPEIWEYSAKTGITMLFIEDVVEMGIPKVLELTKAVIGPHPCYVTFDIDSLDPAFAPGTGTPEAGGLTTREALSLLRGLRPFANVIGADVVEVAPPFDVGGDGSGVTSLAAASVMYELLCLMAEVIHKRGRTPAEK